MRAPGYIRDRVVGSECDWAAIDADRSFDVQTVVLKRGASIRGRVLSREGSPVCLVGVEAAPATGTEWDWRREYDSTNSLGEYFLDGVDPDLPVILAASRCREEGGERVEVPVAGRLVRGATFVQDLTFATLHDVSVVVQVSGHRERRKLTIDGFPLALQPDSPLLTFTTQGGSHRIECTNDLDWFLDQWDFEAPATGGTEFLEVCIPPPTPKELEVEQEEECHSAEERAELPQND